MRFDAIVVLGAGLKGKKTNDEANARLNMAKKLYDRGLANKIIVTGGFTKPNVNISEASAMKTYLISKKVRKDDIIKEEKSKDTIGNIFFTKNTILKPRRWKKVLFVTTEDHIRAKYIAKKILGKKYMIKFEMVPLGFWRPIYRLLKIEDKLFELTRIFFRGIKPSNDKQIRKMIFSINPCYIDKKRLKMFAKLSDEQLSKLSGVSLKTIREYKHNPFFLFYLNNRLKIISSGVAGI